MSRSTICIKPSEFISDRFIISDPKEIKIKNSFKMKISEIYYINDQNQPSDLYISLPTVETYGPFPQYNFNSTSKNINGLDIVSKYGELTPMINIRSIYFGAHGSSDYNCSLQSNIAKAIFKEKQNIIPDFTFDGSDNEEEYED